MSRIYFDNAATTALHPEVKEAILPYLYSHFANPSSIHSHGREARMLVEKARKTIATLLNTSPSQIFFTSGGTEADNMSIVGAIEKYNIRHVISSKIEHHAVLHTLQNLEKKNIISLHFVNILPSGDIDLQHLETLLFKFPDSLVSLMHGNNEIGNMLDLEVVTALCKKHEALFHSDTVQTMGHFKFDLKQTKIDFLVGAGHKFHGLKGTGFLYLGEGISIPSFIKGGAQERNMRGGTENILGIVACAKALDVSYINLEADTLYIKDLKKYFIERIKNILPDVCFNGNCENMENSLYTVVNVMFPKTEIAEMLLFNLDINQISVSGGSACTSGSNMGSHVLNVLYGNDDDRPAIRFSFSKFNTKAEIDFCMGVLKKLFK